jgi:hypothetical protein
MTAQLRVVTRRGHERREFVRPSHPRAAEGEHGFGRGKARAGSARSERRQATTNVDAHLKQL